MKIDTGGAFIEFNRVKGRWVSKFSGDMLVRDFAFTDIALEKLQYQVEQYNDITQYLTIKCKDCGKEFIFSTVERDNFIAKGLEAPKRCAVCRKIRRTAKEAKQNKEVVNEDNG